MSALGVRMTVAACTDPTTRGISGTLVLESANMLVLNVGGRLLNLPKRGTVLRSQTGVILIGDDMAGRLEDRLRLVRP